MRSTYQLMIFSTILLSAHALASTPSYTCYNYGMDSKVIDINASVEQICEHAGQPVSDCSLLNQPFLSIVQFETGHDTTLPMGYLGFFATGSDGGSYFRVYSKPFVVGANPSRLVYRAVAVGSTFRFKSVGDFSQPVQVGDLVCAKK